MMSQFLGLMLDACDMSLVLVMAPNPGQEFCVTKRQFGMAVRRNCVRLFHYDGGPTDWLSDLWRLADRIGRCLLLVMTIAGVGVMSLLGGFLPTYAQEGVWAYGVFCILRLYLGIFFGGEYAPHLRRIRSPEEAWAIGGFDSIRPCSNWRGASSPCIFASASRPAVALWVLDLDIPQALCWERGSFGYILGGAIRGVYTSTGLLPKSVNMSRRQNRLDFDCAFARSAEEADRRKEGERSAQDDSQQKVNAVRRAEARRFHLQKDNNCARRPYSWL